METPDVLGLWLSDALYELGRANVSSITVVRTQPPGKAPRGGLRVIRQTRDHGRVELVVAASFSGKGV